jgi:phage antirepressor YoqD-like protein
MLTIGDVGKTLKCTRKIFDMLYYYDIIYRHRYDNTWLPYEQYIDRGLFIVKDLSINTPYNTTKERLQTYVTSKGIDFIKKVHFCYTRRFK